MEVETSTGAVRAAPPTLTKISNRHIGTKGDIDKTKADYGMRVGKTHRAVQGNAAVRKLLRAHISGHPADATMRATPAMNVGTGALPDWEARPPNDALPERASKKGAVEVEPPGRRAALSRPRPT